MIRKYKLKPQYYTTTHLLEGLKLKILIMPSVGKDVEQLELSYTAGGNKIIQSLCKTVWQVIKSQTYLLYELANVLLQWNTQ